MSVVIDLDILKPEQKFIKLNGISFDVSFVPCGISFEVDKLVQELAKIPQKKILAGGAECKKAYDISISLCSLFVSNVHPDMNEDWFRKNVDAVQVTSFAKEIQNALTASYKGVEDYGKK